MTSSSHRSEADVTDQLDVVARRCAVRVSRALMARVMAYGPDYDDSDLVDQVTVACAHGADPTMRRLYGKFLDESSRKTMSRVREVLLRDVLQNPKARLMDVKESLRRVGIDAVDEDDSVIQTLVRTQHSIVQNARAWLDGMRDPSVWGWAILTAEDERVRPAHKPFDGVRYPKRHRFWRKYFPPNGWGCRCRAVPIYWGERRARLKRFDGVPEVDPTFLFNPGAAIGRVRIRS